MRFFLLSLLVLLIPPVALAKVDTVKKAPKKITSEAGLNIPAWGVAVDAVYDKRLDTLLPGYKILNVVLSNRGIDTIYLDPSKDKWVIIDSVGRKHHAINHLRKEDEKLWDSLPDGLRQKLEYPQAVKVGNSAKIDLFFSSKTELAGFREIEWDSVHFKKEFNILTASENNLEAGPKEEPLPKEAKSQNQALEKYEGRQDPPPSTPSETPPREIVTIPMD
ncbi:MAG: hypothetical protein Q7T11_03665 [Deltaproteobacteria bacterium]|nr:hypothetical protein [Deltaproteobacteria bacterium]